MNKNLISTKNPNGLLKTYKVGKEEKIGEGSESTVNRVDLRLQRGQRSKNVQLVEKVFEYPISRDSVLQKYNLAKSSGLNVPNTFRLTERGALITDLTEGGKNLVISAMDADNDEYLEDLKLNKQDLYKLFVEADIEEVAKYGYEDLEKAANSNICLSHADIWFLVLKPEGNREFVIGDFTNLFKTEDPKELTRELNEITFERCISRLIEGQDFAKNI